MVEVNHYIDDVLSGKLIACKSIIKACQRFRDDLNNEDYFFDSDHVIKLFSLTENLKHFTGHFNDINFKLLPWQKVIVAHLYGFRFNHNVNKHVYDNLYLQIARKNGKTALASVFAIIDSLTEKNSQVVLAANSREQAKVAFQSVSGFLKKIDPREKWFKIFRNEIKFNDCLIKVVSADHSKLDGLNLSCCIQDEFHESPNMQMYSVLRSSQGFRMNPKFIIITTAGQHLNYPCYELYEKGLKVLNKQLEQPNSLYYIFEQDSEEEINEPQTWIKSNPNLNITVNENFIKNELINNNFNPELHRLTLTKHLNYWVSEARNNYVPMPLVLEQSKKIDLELFQGSEAFVGVDLASVIDLSAVSILIKSFNEEEKDYNYYFFNTYYLPQKNKNSEEQQTIYRKLAKQGYITLTPGNVTDYNYIIKDLKKIGEKLIINRVYYDQNNATQWALSMQDEGFTLEPYSQSISKFNKPTKEFQRLFLNKKIIIEQNPITQQMLQNVILKQDQNGNQKPTKEDQNKKIDGVIAMLMALACSFEQTPVNFIY